jgi:hypothetical protein
MMSSLLTSTKTTSWYIHLSHYSYRNNHLRQHRTSLRDAIRAHNPPVRLLALNWAFDEPLTTIHRICSDRIYDRGGKHQTLRADVDGGSHENVIWKFIAQREELDEGEVDAVIEMDITEDLEHALDRAVDGCVRALGLEKPDQEKIGLALAAARAYEPTKRKEDRKEKEKVKEKGEEKKNKAKPPRYYGFVPEVDLLELLNPVFSAPGDAEAADGRQFLTRLKKNSRVTKQPHITIVHRKLSTWSGPSHYGTVVPTSVSPPLPLLSGSPWDLLCGTIGLWLSPSTRSSPCLMMMRRGNRSWINSRMKFGRNYTSRSGPRATISSLSKRTRLWRIGGTEDASSHYSLLTHPRKVASEGFSRRKRKRFFTRNQAFST